MGSAPNRIEWVDAWKGILILLVVVGHAFQGIWDAQADSPDMMAYSIYAAKLTIYSFHMPAFFIASGLFAGSLWRKTASVELKKRLRRLAWPYFLWGGITAVFMEIASSYTNAHLGLINFLLSPIVPFSIFWYLYVLFFIFLLHLVLSRVFGQRANAVLVWLGVVLYVASPFIPDVWILRKLSQELFFYAIGFRVLEWSKEKPDNMAKTSCLICSILVFAATVALYVYCNFIESEMAVHYSMFLSSMAGAALTIECAGHAARASLKASKALAWCGRESMGIYVMHLIPLAGLRVVILKVMPDANLWLLAILITIISTMICCAAIQLFRKVGLYEYVL